MYSNQSSGVQIFIKISTQIYLELSAMRTLLQIILDEVRSMTVVLCKVGLLLLFLVIFVLVDLVFFWHSHPQKLVPGNPMNVLMYYSLKAVR